MIPVRAKKDRKATPALPSNSGSPPSPSKQSLMRTSLASIDTSFLLRKSRSIKIVLDLMLLTASLQNGSAATMPLKRTLSCRTMILMWN